VTGLGVAGLGWLGESLIKDVPGCPGLEVVAVQDASLARAREVAARHAVPWAGEHFDDLLRADGVDAVAICTPNAFHAPQARAAVGAGKHVLVQKPLALSAVDAEATVEAAEQANRLLVVDYSYRFLETIATLRSAADVPIRAARAVFHNIYGPGQEKTWFFQPGLSGGGALTDLGVHLLDLGLWLLAPRDVALLTACLDGSQPVEHAAALRLALDDIPFDLEVSWNARRAETEIAFDLELSDGSTVRWENVGGSFFRFRTLRDGAVLLERETTLREDTLHAFSRALALGRAPAVDTRVYAVLDRAYGRHA
jgi:predicted dehydrogenase